MQFASCWRQPAALFIWLPGESGQLGSAGLKVPGAPFLSPILEFGVEPPGSGEVEEMGAGEAPSPPTAIPWEQGRGRGRGGVGGVVLGGPERWAAEVVGGRYLPH